MSVPTPALDHDDAGVISSPVGAVITANGRRYSNFGGSSYLGLAGAPQILQAGAAALFECGAGAPMPVDQGLRTRAHQDVEAQAARFFGQEAALYLSAGYLFGLVALGVLRHELDLVFFDELAHYSLREAIAASGLPGHAYRHLDAEDLADCLRRHVKAGQTPLVVTDGMFSTRGEIPPIAALSQVVAPYGGRMLIDESHSFGVLGATGRGVTEQLGLDPWSVLVGGSLGKAFGACGGVILASRPEIDRLRSAPAARGAAGGMPAAAAMSARSLAYVSDHPDLLQRLRSNVAHLKRRLREIGLDVGDSTAPVAAFTLGSAPAMAKLKRRLMAEGVFVYHSSYIGAGADGVIRCGVFADHTADQIDQLADILWRLL